MEKNVRQAHEYEKICNLIEIDNQSPTGAVWAKNFKKKNKGDIFGYLTSNKRYWRQKINGKQYNVHNIIWIKFYGPIPSNKTVDHIDKNGLNNAVDNLRLAETIQQLHNRRTWSKSNFKGVSQENKTKRYAAYIMYPKYGRVHLGYYKYAEHAAIAHDIAATIIFSNNAYYNLNYSTGFWLSKETLISNKVLEKLNVFFEKCV